MDRNAALLHFEIAVLQGGEEVEHLLRHDLDKLNADIEADERASVSSEAHAWYVQHHSAQKFIVKDPEVARYFPLPSNPAIIKGAFATRTDSQPASTPDPLASVSDHKQKTESRGFRPDL